jgi:hypothetical protein
MRKAKAHQGAIAPREKKIHFEKEFLHLGLFNTSKMPQVSGRL